MASSGGQVPKSPTRTDGSSRWGADAVTATNLELNSPSDRWWLRCSISPKLAASQKAVAPPLPITTS